MLTPQDIQNREFLVSLRGYDRDEVHAFLDEVAEDFSSLISQARGAGGEIPAPEAEAEEVEKSQAPAEDSSKEAAPAEPSRPSDPSSAFAAIGAETQRILEAAQAAGDEIRSKAEAEAKALSEQRLQEAQQDVEALREEEVVVRKQIEDLEGRRRELADRLRQARETVDLALLEVEEPTPEGAPADANTSVLAADEPDEDAAEDETAEPAGGEAAEGGSDGAPATGAGDAGQGDDVAEDVTKTSSGDA